MEEVGGRAGAVLDDGLETAGVVEGARFGVDDADGGEDQAGGGVDDGLAEVALDADGVADMVAGVAGEAATFGSGRPSLRWTTSGQ